VSLAGADAGALSAAYGYWCKAQLQLLYLHDPEHISFGADYGPCGPAEAPQTPSGRRGFVAHLGVAGGPIDLVKRFVETDILRWQSHQHQIATPASIAKPASSGCVSAA